MGMSTHIVGFRPADEKWRAMKAVYDACKVATIEVPSEVLQFFNYETPDEQGVSISLERDSAAVRPWKDDYRQGFEVEISALDPTIKIIRFFNSW